MSSIRRRCLLTFLFAFSVLALGCNQSKSGSSTGNSASPATPQAATTQVAGSGSPLPPEEFHAVDFKKTGLTLEIKAMQMEWDAKGSITLCSGCALTAIDAHGHSMPIGLASKSIRDSGFQTKDFGIIKMRGLGNPSFSGGEFLMQDSHLNDLKQRLEEYVSAKHVSKASVHH